MNALRMAQSAYGQNHLPIRTDRGTEYDAFARVTRRLKQSAMRGSSGFADLADALQDNRQLWSLLAMDLADDGNGLPDDLRARILSLADFTMRHSSKVLRRVATVEPLIEINAAMMRGLRDRSTST